MVQFFAWVSVLKVDVDFTTLLIGAEREDSCLEDGAGETPQES